MPPDAFLLLGRQGEPTGKPFRIRGGLSSRCALRAALQPEDVTASVGAELVF